MGLAGFNLRRKRAEQKRQEGYTDATVEQNGYTDATVEQNGYEHGDDLGKKATQLLRMNKNALCEYGSTLGLNLDPGLPKETLIDMIQRKEQE